MFNIKNNIAPTVNDISEVQAPQITLPTDFDGFQNNVAEYFSLLFKGDNFICYLKHISGVITGFAKILVIILPCIVILAFIIKALYKKGNNKHGKDTVPLKVFKAITKVTYLPIKRLVAGYIAFIKENKWIWICWIIVLLLHFKRGFYSVRVLRLLLFFIATFDVTTLYTQFVKLFADLKISFIYFPYWALLFLIYPLFDRFRRRIAVDRLRHFEARNCGFINELPIVSLTCGSMGKKKTTAITDMTLSQEVMFRQKAFDILQKNDMKFPHFPWIKFEKALQAEMENGQVYNLATVKCWVISLEERGELFGYDGERYGLIYDDGLKEDCIYNVLSTYAQAYFIYIIESSLIVSNYSIREDNLLADSGNFPMWLTDFFPTNFRRNSRHAHILDFDILRLGKKVIENNPKAGSFEFGVVAISEVGKERGNNLELQEKKKNADEANQKNDLFNSWLKMCRHAATVDNFPFIKVFTDEQRPESWGADARDLCDIVKIVQSTEQKLALPFYTAVKTCLRHFCERKGWRYMGVWERGKKTNRLHFHGLFYIPEGTLSGEFVVTRDYNFKKHTVRTVQQSSFFLDRFGRNEMEELDGGPLFGHALAYILKYLEKTGERITCSKRAVYVFLLRHTGRRGCLQIE